MREAEFRSIVVGLLNPLAAFPVENIVDDGTPDICCAVGWIETKLGVYPKRKDTRVQVSVRESQRSWMRRWTKTGARVWTLTLVDNRETILHDGKWSCDRLGVAGREEFIELAIAHWKSTRPIQKQLIDSLIGKKT